MNPLKWLLGAGLYNRAAVTTKALAYWLIGKPIDAGGEIAVAAGEATIDNQILVVRQLAEAIGHQQSLVELCNQTLSENLSKIETLEKQGQRLIQHDEDAAMQVALELEALEQMTPQFEADLLSARSAFETGQERLKEQQLLLKQMEIQQKSNATQERIAKAREEAQRQMDAVQLTGTRTLERATEAIQRRGSIAQGVSEATRSIGETDRKIAQIGASDRLSRFRNPQITEAK